MSKRVISEQMNKSLKEGIRGLSDILESRLAMIDEGLLNEGKENGTFMKSIMTEAVMLYEMILREALSELDQDEFQQMLESCVELAGIAGPTVKAYVLQNIKPHETSKKLMKIEDWQQHSNKASMKNISSMSNVRETIAQVEREVLDTTSRVAKLIMALNGVGNLIQSGKIKLPQSDEEVLMQKNKSSRLNKLLGRDPVSQVAKFLKSYNIQGLDVTSVARDITSMLPNQRNEFIRDIEQIELNSNVRAINDKMKTNLGANKQGILGRVGDFMGKVLDIGMPGSGKTFGIGGGTFGGNTAY